MPMSQSYLPIDCNLYDRYLALATLRSPIRLVYQLPEVTSTYQLEDTIADVYTQDGAEWLRTTNGVCIRLDHILQLQPLPVG
jgi:transcriptional antiterminator Rof (Rho-off)